MKKKIALILLAALVGQAALYGQKTFTVSGYVTDAESSETLISATVLDRLSGLGAVTNAYGFYSLTLPEGDVELVTRYLGYRGRVDAFRLEGDTVLALPLLPMAELDEVEIIGNRLDLGVQGSQMSAIDIPVEQIKAVPALFGEADVLKALQLLPGVQGGTEGSAGLYVRGGAPDENLLLLDGVPVYNVNHMFGLFSVFNPDAIKNVTLYKGSFPAHYCGRLSSVVDIRMKDGDMYKWHGNVALGLVSSKLNFEGPIVKGKTSVNISARRTYSDIFLNAALWGADLIDKEIELHGAMMGYFFDDLNVKLNHKLSDRDRLYVSWYSGNDDIYFRLREREGRDYTQKTRFDWKWGNMVGVARWNHVVNSRLFMDISANYTQYRHHMGIKLDETDKRSKLTQHMAIDMRSGIFDETARADFHWSPTPQHEVRFGTFYTHHLFRPDVATVVFRVKQEQTADTEAYDQNTNTRNGQKDIDAHEAQAYIEDNMTLWDVVKVNAGLSTSFFNVGGRSYFSPEPRVSGRVLLADDLSMKAGYAYMSQYVHLLSNNSLSLPTDLWVPVTERILPEKSHQWALGLFYNLKDYCDLSLEGYYKLSDNLLEYREGVSFMTGSTDWQDKVAMGRGWSYGVELMAQRSVGKLNGWAAYTWSHTRRLFDREGMVLNNGRPFNAKYDRRHEVDITGNYKFSDRFDLSATWVYATGNCGTVYTQYFVAPSGGEGWYNTLGYSPERNNFRLNPYHRLDLGFNFHRILGKRVHRTLNLSIYNAYNNLNPFIIYTDEEYNADTDTWRTALKQVSLYPIIPTISYGLSF